MVEKIDPEKFAVFKEVMGRHFLKIANDMNNKNKPIFIMKRRIKHVTVLGSGIMGRNYCVTLQTLA